MANRVKISTSIYPTLSLKGSHCPFSENKSVRWKLSQGGCVPGVQSARLLIPIVASFLYLRKQASWQIHRGWLWLLAWWTQLGAFSPFLATQFSKESVQAGHVAPKPKCTSANIRCTIDSSRQTDFSRSQVKRADWLTSAEQPVLKRTVIFASQLKSSQHQRSFLA